VKGLRCNNRSEGRKRDLDPREGDKTTGPDHAHKQGEAQTGGHDAGRQIVTKGRHPDQDDASSQNADAKGQSGGIDQRSEGAGSCLESPRVVPKGNRQFAGHGRWNPVEDGCPVYPKSKAEGERVPKIAE